MKKIAGMLLPLILLLTNAKQSHSQESLYKRLGGYDAIAAVTDDFIGRLVTHKDLSRFFTGGPSKRTKQITGYYKPGKKRYCRSTVNY